jgi:hypothetical protein
LKNRILIFSLIFSILSVNIVSADLSRMKDIHKSSSYAKSAIEYLSQKNYISGDDLGNFNPQKSITRAEMAALLTSAMGLDTSKNIEQATFQDVPAGHWASKYVEAAYREGIVNGVTTTEFKPEDQITREQMASMVVRALKILDKNNKIEISNINIFSDKAKISSWVQKEVEVGLEAGLMEGASSSIFNPQGSANKEQAAVVIERLIKNQQQIREKFSTITQDQQAVKLVINKENVILKNKIALKDGQVYIPVEFLNKFVVEAMASDLDENAGTIGVAPGIEYKSAVIQSLWFKVGSLTAYKNAQEDPFQKNGEVGEQMALEAAPIQLEGKTYIPAKDIFGLLGISYSYDEAANTLTVQNDNISQSPNLYFALKQLAYGDYIGEVKSQGELRMTDKNTKTSSVISFEMEDKQKDNNTIWSRSKKTTEVTGQAPELYQKELVIMDSKLYQKNPSDGKWTQTALQNGSTYVYTPFYDPIYEKEEIKSVEINALLFDYLSQLQVKNQGIVYVSGVPAVKYVINLDLDSIKNMMTQEDYAAVKEFAQTTFGGKLDYQYEFYVADSKIIKQTYTFDGSTTAKATEIPLNYHAYTVIYYKNIGTAPAITAPAASQVKEAK